MPEPTAFHSASPETAADACHPLNDKPPETAGAPAGSAEDSCHLSDDKTGGPGATAAVIELRVRNHPGTMSHVTGLFARRGFNLEAIVCVPVGDGATSVMLLLVADEPRLEQVERQLAKLFDVLTVLHRPDLGREFFSRLVPAG